MAFTDPSYVCMDKSTRALFVDWALKAGMVGPQLPVLFQALCSDLKSRLDDVNAPLSIGNGQQKPIRVPGFAPIALSVQFNVEKIYSPHTVADYIKAEMLPQGATQKLPLILATITGLKK